MSVTPTVSLEGTSLGKYQILTAIGTGNMATVYLAHDPFIDRPVALKVARPDSIGDDADGRLYKQVFFNEAQTAGLLKHPNITAIYDAGVDRDNYYIVMEYVHSGRTLDRYTNIENLLPVEEVTRILYQCAMALDYAHKKGVVHRDIKPRNILLTEDHEAKITDFGVALAPGIAAHSEVEHAGSPLYMAPEQIRREPATSQSDLFALGVIAYEMLTGKHPFHGGNQDVIEHNILHKPSPRLSKWRTDVPEIYQRIIDKALARDCRQRYRSGRDMAGDISLVFDFLKLPVFRLSQQEKYSRVEALHFFKPFPDGELWELINAGEWMRLPTGTEIMREGEADTSFFILINGEVVVRRKEHEIVRLYPGDCFGEMGMLSRKPRTATIVAGSEVTLIKLRDTTVDRMSVNCQLRFQRQFLIALIERLDHATDRIANRAEDA
ncbi:MAG: protein kinase [Gammaproteobacteria bacterium]|nr:protein kinase [Gammaproteobacteria bacterium]